MRHALFAALFCLIIPGSAQTEPTPLNNNELKEVQEATSALLTQSICLLADGSARTTHQIGDFAVRVELKGLKIAEVLKAPISKEEESQGITRRYLAKMSCQSHRIWDGPLVKWSEWKRSHYGFLPSTVIVEEVNGKMVAKARLISQFSRGVDEQIASTGL